MISEIEINTWFTYHKANDEQAKRYEVLRESAKNFARDIVACTPPSADQTAAIRKVREAVMTANASIACSTPTPAA